MSLPPGGLSDDDQVQVRFGDIKRLDNQVTDLTDSLNVAKADIQLIVNTLGLDITEQITAHQVVVSHIVPALKKLVAMASSFQAIDREAKKMIADNPQIQLPDGSTATLAGRRLPDAMARKLGIKPRKR